VIAAHSLANVDDLPRLLESPALLARKFDAAVDAAILDELESRIRPSLQP